VFIRSRRHRHRGEGSGDEGGHHRRSGKGREAKERKRSRKGKDDVEGLSAKQRRKVVSKALISSSENSDSEGEKLRIQR